MHLFVRIEESSGRLQLDRFDYIGKKLMAGGRETELSDAERFLSAKVV